MPQPNLTRRAFTLGLAASALAACSQPTSSQNEPASSTPETPDEPQTDSSASLDFDMSAWNYDSDDDIWWQKEVVYCEKPAAREYESLAIYVPGPYLRGTLNDDGVSYSCKVVADGSRGRFTCATAPVLIPINGGSYAAELSPTGYNYSGLEPYLETGFIYVYPGFRGRSNAYNADGSLAYEGGAPWSVVDLKAAVRYLRYNAETLPGDLTRVFAFGLGAGGTHANLLGASGDAPFFEPYLKQIGAATKNKAGEALSDAIFGCVSWVPEGELIGADAAYEWLLGQYVAGGSAAETRAEGSWTCEFSRDLARLWQRLVNEAGLTDNAHAPLTIDDSVGGICCAGSYYQLLCAQLEASLNAFISTTRFPYAEGAVDYLDDGNFAGGDSSSRAAREQAAFGSTTNYAVATFATPADYIAALDAGLGWVSFDDKANVAHVNSLAGYATVVATPEREASGYDTPALSSPENLIFGTADEDSAHYNPLLASLLEENATRYAHYSGWDDALVEEWTDDLTVKDSAGNTPEERLNATDPLYYLAPSRGGVGSSTVAPHWRIQFGTHQGVTPLTMYTNLLLALRDCGQAPEVSSELVWGQGHALVESSGNAVANFIGWVEDRM